MPAGIRTLVVCFVIRYVSWPPIGIFQAVPAARCARKGASRFSSKDKVLRLHKVQGDGAGPDQRVSCFHHMFELCREDVSLLVMRDGVDGVELNWSA